MSPPKHIGKLTIAPDTNRVAIAMDSAYGIHIAYLTREQCAELILAITDAAKEIG